MFDYDEIDDELYFHTSQSVEDVISLNREALASALAAPENAVYASLDEFRKPLANSRPTDPYVEVDLSMFSWEPFFQNIVKRSQTLKYVTAMTSYCCSHMRADGFGGMAILITADEVSGKDTNDLLEELLSDAGIEPE